MLVGGHPADDGQPVQVLQPGGDHSGRPAADGRAVDRAEFARRYAPVIRAYLGARWRGNGLAQEVDDAVQDVFVDCFSENGALTRLNDGVFHGHIAFAP